MRGRHLVAVLWLISCTAEPEGDRTSTPAESHLAMGATHTTALPASRVPSQPWSPPVCPVSLPNGDSPPGQPSRSSHGNGRLWVVLWWPRGIIRAREDDLRADDSLVVKVPWTRGVAGRLTINGRRLDAVAPPLRAWIPRGYGRRGFQSTAVVFPTAGCWEVTGRVGGVSLTVVTKVVWPKSSRIDMERQPAGPSVRVPGSAGFLQGE